jgi:DNA polymerase III epsilon subunit-like protein
MWHQHPIIIIDFETTGVDAATCVPVEVAAARFEAGKCVATKVALCDPGITIPLGASNVHGLFDADVAGAPPPEQAIFDVLSGLLEWRDVGDDFSYGPQLCAYNAPFDGTLFRRFAPTTVKLSRTGLGWLDPLVWVRSQDKYERGKGRHTLTAACQRRGIVAQGAHRAEADATMAGQLLWSADIQKRLGQRSLSDVLLEQEKLAAVQQAEFAAYQAKVTA